MLADIFQAWHMVELGKADVVSWGDITKLLYYSSFSLALELSPFYAITLSCRILLKSIWSVFVGCFAIIIIILTSTINYQKIYKQITSYANEW